MNSSILHFNPSRRGLKLIAASCILIFSLSFCYQFFINPEHLYWEKAIKYSDEWNKHLSEKYSTKYVIFGGSTTRTSIDPELLENEFNLPVINAALHAGFGAPALTELALKYVNPGDTLIVALEPGFLRSSSSESNKDNDKYLLPSTHMGDVFLVFEKKTSSLHGDFLSCSWRDLCSFFMIDTLHSCTMLGKMIIGMPLYRYNEKENLHPSGWMEVKEKRTLKNPAQYTYSPSDWKIYSISDGGRKFLKKLLEWGKQNNVKIVYSLPRGYGYPSQRIGNAILLHSMIEIMPVLKDPSLGINPELNEFTDTERHPNRIGAHKATRELGRELNNNDFWSKKELEQIIVLSQKN